MKRKVRIIILSVKKNMVLAVILLIFILSIQNIKSENIHFLRENITIQTNSNNYSNGECIHISGNLTNVNLENDTFSDNVTIKLEYRNWKRYETTKLKNNSYDYYYNISYGDPHGAWNITSEISDNVGNIVSNYTNINVTIPIDTVRYNVVWFSPVKDAIYEKGSTFDISVFVTEDGVGVKNALTNCIIPPMEKINLTEVKQGYYQETYKIPWSSDSGTWILSLESVKITGSSLKAGGGNTSIIIKPAKINLDLIQPSLNKYNFGDTIEIKVNLSYPDGTFVKNSTVTAKILGENITLIELKNGSYSADYTISIEDKGSFIIEIFSSDEYNNNASTTKIVQIVYQEDSSFPIYTVISVIIVLLVIILILYFLRKKFSVIRLQDAEEEIKEVEKLQNEAAENYYKRGSITRQTYDLLRKEHSERLAELKKDFGKKNKLKKISKKMWER
jgi:hypothetical protein